jgi:hypothetical protein
LRRQDRSCAGGVIADAFRGVKGPEIVEYVLDIQEVQVLGDHAFE